MFVPLRIVVYVFLLLPLIASAQPTLNVIWDRSGLQDSSGYGYEILPLGDQNNDGYADWAVVAHGNPENTGTIRTSVEFFHGSAVPSTVPYLILQSDPNGAWWIFDTGVAGDLNGDGYQDWFVTRRYTATSSFHTLFVYFGGPEVDTTADLMMTTEVSNGFIPVYNFNGDEFDDLCLYHFPADWSEIFFGGTAMDTLPDWIRHSPAGCFQQAYPWHTGHDLNGDGYSDWVSATLGTWTTYIFLGGANPDTVPAYTWENLEYWPIGAVNDVNGDHYDELAYGIQWGAELHLGGVNLSPTSDVTLNFPCTIPDASISAGDFNRDGYGDLVLLTDYCASSPWGVLSLYLGHPWIYSQPAFSIYGNSGALNLLGIWTAVGLGDVNGDGVDDLAIGAYTDNYPDGMRGRVVIIAGDTGWVAGVGDVRPEFPQAISINVYPNPFNAQTTLELDVPLGINRVKLTTYNLLGQTVRQEEVDVHTGSVRYTYDGSVLSTGMYFLNAAAGAFSATQKLMVLR